MESIQDQLDWIDSKGDLSRIDRELVINLIRLNTTDGRRAYYMKDWIKQNLSPEWKMYHLEDDVETWVMEHVIDGCDGTVAYDAKEFKCSVCEAELPSKFITAIMMRLKRDLIRV